LDEQTPYIDRKMWIDIVVIPISKYFVEVDTKIVKSNDHMNELFQNLLNNQQEGGILRKMDAPYEHKRSKNLVKVKMTEDNEGLITKIIEGDGNASGLAAKATIVWDGPDGKTEFDATFMGTVETRQEILKNPKDWVGKTVTFLYEGLTGKIPRKPNYGRINPYNCFSVDK
jgi:DNA ligase-1